MKQSKHIWIVNPFDEIPNETDIPLRFWTLCKVLSNKGYKVTWWSSDYSHRNKIKRLPCQDTDGFSVRLVKTPPYKNNISFSRLRNHRAFSQNFYKDALKKIKENPIELPVRIVISIPPLGLAENAFKIRDYVNNLVLNNNSTSKNSKKKYCKIIVDIMDAWPEAFYRIFPKKIKKYIAPIILYPFHKSAETAFKKTDMISAVGKSYIDIAKKYLETRKILSLRDLNYKNNFKDQILDKPMHLCYHGVDLNRFDKNKILKRLKKYNEKTKKDKFSFRLNIVYIGVMNTGYDLETIINVLKNWKKKNQFPLTVHFAGKGNQLNNLILKCKKLELLEDETNRDHKNKIIFYGHLNNLKLNNLLLSADIALVTNRTDTLVACPYKAGEYSGAGLPMISCLDGEFNHLINDWNAGFSYNAGDTQSLCNAIDRYSRDLKLLKNHSLNARKMAEKLFDRKKTYDIFSEFILKNLK